MSLLRALQTEQQKGPKKQTANRQRGREQKGRAEEVIFDPQTPILALGTSGRALRGRDLDEGVFVAGAPGSGKSSTIGVEAPLAALKAGASVVFFTEKEGDEARALAITKAAGREADVSVMRVGGDVKNNLVDTAFRFGGVEEVVATIGVAARAVGPENSVGRSDDKTWQTAGDNSVRFCCDLSVAAGSELSLEHLAELIATAPTSKKEAAVLRELEKLLGEGSMRPEDLTTFQRDWIKAGWNFRKGNCPLDPNTLRAMQRYWLHQFPGLSDKTLSSVRFSMENSIIALTRGAIADLCTSETTFDFSSLRSRKVLILALPPARYGTAGRAIQTMVLYLVQRQLERDEHRGGHRLRPVMLFIDEAQSYVNDELVEFLARARSSRAWTVLITQSFAGIRRKLGPESTNALLEVLNTKILFAPADRDTAEISSALIGEEWNFEPTLSSSGGYTFNDQKRRMVEPEEFMDLERGGRDFDFLVRSFVFKPSTRWGPNGENFLEVVWKQRRNL